MAITAGILLFIYVAAIVGLIFWPTRRRHPEDGQAVGCLMLVAIGCALLGCLLYLAVHFHFRFLVYAIFAVAAYPALYVGPQLIWRGWKRLREKSQAKGRRLLGDELMSRLRGQTHIFHRNSLEPRREYDELKFYSPDGNLLCYERENGELKRLNVDATWTVRGDLLHTLGQYGPGTKNVFSIWETPDGRLAYYIHEPFSTLNRRLSLITTEVRKGGPDTL